MLSSASAREQLEDQIDLLMTEDIAISPNQMKMIQGICLLWYESFAFCLSCTACELNYYILPSSEKDRPALGEGGDIPRL
ncbi:MAG: hypothetical protein D3906_00750 [Candidatus Electrothrix sp. AUS1_2]|nr:hypothetical protein [Candidatus Electrothrix sp. AUS1_2]